MRQCDRRKDCRPSVRFQPACLEFDHKSYIALLRDVSRSGAGFESDLPVRPGDILRYRWGNSDFINGRISWAQNGRFGVENLSTPAFYPVQSKYAYRSVRIPVFAETTVYIDQKPQLAVLHNVAQRGVCVELPQSLRIGALLSIRLGTKICEAACVKWSAGNRTGVALRQSLRIGEITQAIQHCHAAE